MTRVSDGFETSRWKVLLLCKLVSRQSLGSDRVKYLKENVTITNSGGMLNVSMCTKHSLPDQSYLILLLLRPTAPEVSSPDFSEIKGNMQWRQSGMKATCKRQQATKTAYSGRNVQRWQRENPLCCSWSITYKTKKHRDQNDNWNGIFSCSWYQQRSMINLQHSFCIQTKKIFF